MESIVIVNLLKISQLIFFSKVQKERLLSHWQCFPQLTNNFIDFVVAQSLTNQIKSDEITRGVRGVEKERWLTLNSVDFVERTRWAKKLNPLTNPFGSLI